MPPRIKELPVNHPVQVLLDRKQGDGVYEAVFITTAGELTAKGNCGECDLEPDSRLTFGSKAVFERVKAAVETIL